MVNVFRVGDGDKANGGKRIGFRLLVGDGLEPMAPVDGECICNAFVSELDNSESFFVDQLSVSSRNSDSQL